MWLSGCLKHRTRCQLTRQCVALKCLITKLRWRIQVVLELMNSHSKEAFIKTAPVARNPSGKIGAFGLQMTAYAREPKNCQELFANRCSDLMAGPIGARNNARRGRSSAGSRAVKKLRMAARAEPGAPLPPKRPLRLRILGHKSRTSTAISPAYMLDTLEGLRADTSCIFTAHWSLFQESCSCELVSIRLRHPSAYLPAAIRQGLKRSNFHTAVSIHPHRPANQQTKLSSCLKVHLR